MNVRDILFNKRIVLVGAGQLGEMALHLWPKELDKPNLFLDSKKNGDLLGIPIMTIDEHEISSSNIYVLSFFKDSAFNVKKLFKEVFKQDILTVYDIISTYSQSIFSNGWVGLPENFISGLENLDVFSDQKSKNVYRAALEWRYKRSLDDDYPVSDEIKKYDLAGYGFDNNKFDYVIDAGSYDASFPGYLYNSGVTWGSLRALEPDAKRNLAVVRAVEMMKLTWDNVCPIEVDSHALWSSSSGCDFYQNGLLSARVAKASSEDTVFIPTITLDDLLTKIGASPDDRILIKLHIEGSEWPVIESSHEILALWKKTSFLINLSHDEDSLIKVPHAFHKAGNHDLLIRSHSLFGEGLTMCAKSRLT